MRSMFASVALFGLTVGSSLYGQDLRPDGTSSHKRFLEVTQTYGPSVIKASDVDGKVRSAEAEKRPWSGWWYPSKETTLFEAQGNRLSPLQKYDLYVQRTRGHNPKAAEFERIHCYDPQAVGWQGMCDAWALAAVTEPEPKQVVRRAGIDFAVGDLKALLMKAYQQVEGVQRFGEVFTGEYKSYNYPDLYPDQFHRFLQVQLFEKRAPFVMDHDPKIEKWNEPVFRADIIYEQDEFDPELIHVSTWVFVASSRLNDPRPEDMRRGVRREDFVGTKVLTRAYTYDLYTQRNEDGDFEVLYGQWTGNSEADHPDYILLPPAPNARKELINKALDLAIIYEIITGQRAR